MAMENDKEIKLLKNIAELQTTIENLKTKIDIITRWIHSKFDILPEDIKDVLSYSDCGTDQIQDDETISDTELIFKDKRIFTSELNEKTDISNELDNEAEDAPSIKEENFEVEMKDEYSNNSEDDCAIDPLGGLSPSYAVTENDLNNYSDSKSLSTNSTASVKYSLPKTVVVQLEDIYKGKSRNRKIFNPASTKAGERNKKKTRQDKIIKLLENSDDCNSPQRKLSMATIPLTRSSPVDYANELNYECDICHRKFEKKIGLRNHKRKSHVQSKPFQCHFSECKSAFTLRKYFVAHMRHCHPDYGSALKKTKAPPSRIYKCLFKDCNKLYTHSLSFSRHLKQENHFTGVNEKKGAPPKVCQRCFSWFATQEELSDHISNCDFSCELCNQKYSGESDFLSHLESHGNTFKCTFNNCGEILPTTKALLHHKQKNCHLIEVQPESTHSKNKICKDIETQQDKNNENKNGEEILDQSPGLNAYVCRKCGTLYKTREALNKHILSSCYECKICKKNFDIKSEQKEHLLRCMKTAKERTPVKAKYFPEETVLDKLSCVICGLKLTAQSDLEDHMAEHAVKLFPCPHAGCKRKFSTEEEIIAHEIKFHCDSCPKSFQNLVHFKVHNEKAHEGQALYSTFEGLSKGTESNDRTKNFQMGFQCSKCGKLFEKLYKMINHVDVGCLECNICGKTLLTKYGLETHINVVHGQEKSFLCNICGKSLATGPSLQHHIRSQHSSQKTEFKCMSCNKILTTLSGYLGHLKRHTVGGIPKKQCTICGFEFSHTGSLRRHIKSIHENQRRFPCHLCDKSFKTGYHRQYHLKTHDNPNGRKRGLNKDVDDLSAAAKRRKLK